METVTVVLPVNCHHRFEGADREHGGAPGRPVKYLDVPGDDQEEKAEHPNVERSRPDADNRRSLCSKANVVKTGRVRADTTVVSANVDYPTDTRLLAREVSRSSTGAGAEETAPRTPFRAHAAERRVRLLAAHLRLRGAQARDQA